MGQMELATDRRINVDETGRTVIRRKVDQEHSIAVFGRALYTMHLGVTITDTGGKLIFTNLAMARMHGPGTVREHLSVRKDGSESPSPSTPTSSRGPRASRSAS